MSNFVTLSTCVFILDPEHFKANSKFDELFNNYQIETHIYDLKTDDVDSGDEKSPNIDIEDLPLPYYGTYHQHTEDSSKVADEKFNVDPLQSLFPYYNNSPPVAETEIELDNAGVDSALDMVNILQGSFVFPENGIKPLNEFPEIQEAVQPQTTVSDDKFREFPTIPEVPTITQNFEPPKLAALISDEKVKLELPANTSAVETIVMDQKELIDIMGKDENEQILKMLLMNDEIEIIESEKEEKNLNFFEMDKDEEIENKTSSRGDRDLSEEMILIEDHILLPFYE